MTDTRPVTVPLAAFPRPLVVDDGEQILRAALRAVDQGERKQRSSAQGGGVVSTALLTGPQVVLLRAYLLRLPEPETISTRRARREALDRLTGAMP